MSLDVYLVGEDAAPSLDSLTGRIFIREGGQNREITRAEWDERFPEREPVMLSPDPLGDWNPAFEANITHNLGKMAAEVDLYQPLWQPEEIGITHANQLIEPLRKGLVRLLAEEDRLQEFNPANGWGDYKLLVRFVSGYLSACEQFPHAKVEVSR